MLDQVQISGGYADIRCQSGLGYLLFQPPLANSLTDGKPGQNDLLFATAALM
jgi:hypothetical protein